MKAKKLLLANYRWMYSRVSASLLYHPEAQKSLKERRLWLKIKNLPTSDKNTLLLSSSSRYLRSLYVLWSRKLAVLVWLTDLDQHFRIPEQSYGVPRITPLPALTGKVERQIFALLCELAQAKSEMMPLVPEHPVPYGCRRVDGTCFSWAPSRCLSDISEHTWISTTWFVSVQDFASHSGGWNTRLVY